MEFYIFGLLLYPWTGAKHWKTSIHPFSTIFAPFSIKGRLKNVILWLLSKDLLTTHPSNFGSVIRYPFSFRSFLAFMSIAKLT